MKPAAGRKAVAAMLLCCLAAVAAPGAEASGASPAGGPRLMRVMAPEGAGAGRDAVIALSFDRPMDLHSLAGAASFEPGIPFAVSGESEVLVVPVNLLAPGTAYTFRLRAGGARDAWGAELSEEVEVSFTTRSDAMQIEVPSFSYAGPVIEGQQPQGVARAIGFGVGHYPGTGRPGRGNLVLMAHASGQVDFPFNRLFDLAEDSEIRVSYGGRSYLYRLEQSFVVRDTDTWIVDPSPRPLLTFFVCCAADGRPSPTFHPPYRYVVRAAVRDAMP